MNDLILHDAFGIGDIAIRDGRIAALGVDVGTGATVIDLGGALVLPGLTDSHVHLDKTLIGFPWVPHEAEPNRESRIATEKRVDARLGIPTAARATALIERCIAAGTTTLRTHVDIAPDSGLTRLDGVLEARARFAGRIDIEIVAFPQSGLVRAPGTLELLDAALRSGADLVGGLDPQVIDGDRAEHLDAVFGLAERRSVGIDIHLHEPGEIGIETILDICARTRAACLSGRVAVSHGYALGMVPAETVARVADAMAEAGVAVVTDGAGSAAIPPILALRAAGVAVIAGSDNIRDPWNPQGDGDMLDRARLIAWRSDFRRDDQLSVALDLATGAPARLRGETPFGVVAGAWADLCVVRAACVAEAVVARPRRELVLKRGRVVAREGACL